MAEILSNQQLSEDFFLMKVARPSSDVKMGQFFMLRAWDKFPVLSRPISVYDADEESISFLYKVVGQGTEIFAGLQQGDDISLQGPLGNYLPPLSGKIALLGGGVGIAPLYLMAKQLRAASPQSEIDIYLGFRDTPILKDAFAQVADHLVVNVGGFVTDEIAPQNYDHVFTCGPDVMMRILYDKCVAAGVPQKLWISTENRMACGIGACLVCTCKTTDGNKKACKDGPIFKGEAVFSLA